MSWASIPSPRASCVVTFLLSGACGVHEPSGVNTVEVRAEDCASCHLDAWRATTAPAHASLGFGQTCGDCHDQTAWSPSHDFPHTTAFPLTLGHAEPSCASCHLSGFAERPTNSCVACHGGRAASVPDPVHAGLSTSCSACHKTDGFRPSTFKHAWPLSGVHAMLTCGSCHTGNPARYEGTLPACVGCHADDRARADRSVSGHGAYPTTCESCHGFAAFRPSSMK